VRDSEGNPLLVVGDRGRGRTAYFNMCAHNCLTPFPMKSPLEGNEGLSRLPAEFALSFGNG